MHIDCCKIIIIVIKNVIHNNRIFFTIANEGDCKSAVSRSRVLCLCCQKHSTTYNYLRSMLGGLAIDIISNAIIRYKGFVSGKVTEHNVRYSQK